MQIELTMQYIVDYPCTSDQCFEPRFQSCPPAAVSIDTRTRQKRQLPALLVFSCHYVVKTWQRKLCSNPFNSSRRCGLCVCRHDGSSRTTTRAPNRRLELIGCSLQYPTGSRQLSRARTRHIILDSPQHDQREKSDSGWTAEEDGVHRGDTYTAMSAFQPVPCMIAS